MTKDRKMDIEIHEKCVNLQLKIETLEEETQCLAEENEILKNLCRDALDICRKLIAEQPLLLHEQETIDNHLSLFYQNGAYKTLG